MCHCVCGMLVCAYCCSLFFSPFQLRTVIKSKHALHAAKAFWVAELQDTALQAAGWFTLFVFCIRIVLATILLLGIGTVTAAQIDATLLH